jgi:hypothetical protein
VDTDTMLVGAAGLTQAANGKQQITPMVETLGALPETPGEVSELLADFSEANMAACVEADIDPLIATGRESHHLPWQGSQGQGVALLGAPRMQRFREPPPLCEPADAVERMRHRLKTRRARVVWEAQADPWSRSSTSSKRGCDSGSFYSRARGRARGVVVGDTMAWNMRRMAVVGIDPSSSFHPSLQHQ